MGHISSWTGMRCSYRLLEEGDMNECSSEGTGHEGLNWNHLAQDR
jgi:hypothetical protein